VEQNWSEKNLENQLDTLHQIIGLLVVMPSNPETSFFQLAEAIMTLMKEKAASIPKSKTHLKCTTYIKLINYLCTQY
jgi:hypothetical protein